MNRAPRPKKCRNPDCRQWFTPYNSTQKACGPKCAIVVGKADRRQKMREKASQKREQVKTKGELARETQKAFNWLVREYRKGDPCISCGKELASREGYAASAVQAGHYRSTKAVPELRFEPLNVRIQCSQCNADESGNIIEYRKALVQHYGEELVEWLEGPHPPRRWSREELQAMKKLFNRWARQIRDGVIDRE